MQRALGDSASCVVRDGGEPCRNDGAHAVPFLDRLFFSTLLWCDPQVGSAGRDENSASVINTSLNS